MRDGLHRIGFDDTDRCLFGENRFSFVPLSLPPAFSDFTPRALTNEERQRLEGNEE